MTPPIIAVVNQSTLIADPTHVRTMASAVGRQLRKHAAPAWGRTPSAVIALPDAASIPQDAVPIYLLDDPDQADALGYHTEDPDGREYGRVFVRPVLDNGGGILSEPLSVASVLSHEALEWFIDPACNLWADNGQGVSYAVEVGDPVESDSYIIPVHGESVSVSNFVLPEWFDAQAPNGTPFDLLGNVLAPFTMTPGGYVITMKEGQISATFGDQYAEWKKGAKAHPASRTNRRAQHWSTPSSSTPTPDNPLQSR